MPAILDEHEQWVDTNGKPLVGGSVYIGVQNADPEISPQDIFSDRDFATLIANPQALDSNGRTTNKTWVKDRYSITVKDINGVQVYSELDNGEITGVGIVGLTNVQGANTITATASPTITSYVDQVVYSFKTVSINTGPVFLDIDNVGSLEATLSDGLSFVGGEWLANQNVSVVYNSTSDTFIYQQYREMTQAEAEAGTGEVPVVTTALRQAQAIAALETNVAAATQAEQEAATATDVMVTPGRQQFHPSAAKGWAEWNISGVLNGSYNVDSVTDTGVGDWTVIWTTDFSGTDYTCVATKVDTGTIGGNNAACSTKAVGSTRIITFSGTALNETNIEAVNAVAYGDQ